MGENKESAADARKKLCATSKAENVPFVVPNEFENGPADYGISAKAEVTVLVAKDGKVTANHAFAKAKEVDVDSVIKSIEKTVQLSQVLFGQFVSSTKPGVNRWALFVEGSWLRNTHSLTGSFLIRWNSRSTYRAHQTMHSSHKSCSCAFERTLSSHPR